MELPWGSAIGKPLKGHSGKVLTFLFSRSEQYLAPGSEDKSIIIWNKERQEKEYPPLKDHLGPFTPIKFSFGDQKNISGFLDGTIRLWKMSTGEVL